MLILKMYLTFVKIGFLGFGGGYMMIPLFFLEIVENRHWLNYDSVFSIVAMAQTVPGTFATNSATLIGLQVGGPLGALACVAGIITPVFATIFLADRYVVPNLDRPLLKGALRGVAAVVIGIVLGAGLQMAQEAVERPFALVTAATAFLLFYGFRKNAALSMLGAAALGLVIIWLW